jgi:hypothetical protein
MSQLAELCGLCGGTGRQSCGSALCRDGAGQDCCTGHGQPPCGRCGGTGESPCGICLAPGSVAIDVLDGVPACESCLAMPVNDTYSSPVDPDRWERELLATHDEFVAELKEPF